MKVVLLIWYSNKNFCFRKIRSHLAPKINFEIWKCPIFDDSSSNSLTRYKQILSECSLEGKNVLNFTCLPMKFHNRGHTTVHWLIGMNKSKIYCFSEKLVGDNIACIGWLLLRFYFPEALPWPFESRRFYALMRQGLE